MKYVTYRVTHNLCEPTNTITKHGYHQSQGKSGAKSSGVQYHACILSANRNSEEYTCIDGGVTSCGRSVNPAVGHVVSMINLEVPNHDGRPGLVCFSGLVG